MLSPILVTKLFIPPTRSEFVSRPKLLKLLNAGLDRKLTLISAPAGFGKTTVVAELLQTLGDDTSSPLLVAWLSLDEGDNDPVQFLTYFIAALIQSQAIDAKFGSGLQNMLQSTRPPPPPAILNSMINEISSSNNRIICVFEDYHRIQAQPINDILTYLLEHLPPIAHLVIVTREDPNLPLPRLRARDQLSELRANELRFSHAEAGEFLNQVMDLSLSTEDITLLETRTEGWITGLQMAAISMQGNNDVEGFIKSFAGSHRYVLDYLIEEVLVQQPAHVQTFLQKTAILDQLNGDLCDAVMGEDNQQEILEYLERANLFIVLLDNERMWYRYHHLFADLLRQRLHQQYPDLVPELHIRASQWYEENDLSINAFQHAVTANDFDRITRIVEGDLLPIHIRSVVTQIINWLESLPISVLNTKPSLYVKHARLLLAGGQTDGVEEKLQAAETVLQSTELNERNRDLLGQIAANRATRASALHQIETIISQSKRALEYLHPNNLDYRGSTSWKLGYAYLMQGYRVEALKAYTEAVEITKSGNKFNHILAIIGLGMVQEVENQLVLATDYYQRALQLFGDHPQPIASNAHIGLARICYEWNDLEAAQNYGRQSAKLARQFGSNVDRAVVCDLFLVQLKIARGDLTEAIEVLEQIEQSVRQHNFVIQVPNVAAIKVQLLLHQGDLNAAANLTAKHELPISQARVHLAQGKPSEALSILDSLYEEMETKGWKDEILKIKVLQAVALHTQGEIDQAMQLLGGVLALAEQGGYIRTFVDAGTPMVQLLNEANRRGIMLEYVSKLLAAFEAEKGGNTGANSQSLIEPLSPRELEVLQLIANGHTNREISEKLFLALDTVKGHNNRIYRKLGVKNRIQAIRKAISLEIIPPQQA